MRASTLAFLLCPVLLVLQGCCCPSVDPVDQSRHCLRHVEQKFAVDPDRPPGPGLVLGTADFNGSGSVLIKIQVEDLTTYSGNEATITAWSGNGDAPATGATPPSGGSQFFSSSGDTPLRTWTTHIDRNYNVATDSYWVFVKVDHKQADGSRLPRYLWWQWTPSTTTDPDEVHDFNQY